ncbi:NAD-dependent epimerase/dehydratase family protein [Bradyrhizobium sp. ISRA442]|uniref:NAD-dependent epimerase/dehydratase family protein n=1 Tax=Bradyrhizobium sp. ISRA442 TaxID=2866197 RepID=UPI00311AE086
MITQASPTPDLKFAFGGARVMITGGLGFIGSTLAARLVKLGSEVTLVDSLAPTSGANLHNIAPIQDRLRVEMIDVRDVPKLGGLLPGCDYLFNLAGQTGHLESMADPITDLDVNCRAQLALLESCRMVNPGVIVVFASTRQVYGKPDYLPVDEKHPTRPPDVNGVNKLAGDLYHILYHNVYGIRTTVLRLTNTYGPRMRIKDARQTFIGIWLRRVLEGQPFEVWGGEQRRDFTYVDDAVDALLLAAARPNAKGRIFNLGGDEALTLSELGDLLVSANGGGRFVVRSFPPERQRIDIGDYVADDNLFRGTTGWRPAVGIREGLTRSLTYFREHLAHYV